MKRCLLIILLVVAFGSGEDSRSTARLFAIRSTYTRVDVVTKTETVAKPEVCVSLVDVTGACRRKRGIYEGTDILSLVPTPVHQIDKTAAPVLAMERDIDIESSSDGFERVDVIGLDQFLCAPEARFKVASIREMLNNVTLQFYVKMNATLTVTETIVSGTKPFVVSGCTPSPFPYKICDEQGTAESPVVADPVVDEPEAAPAESVHEEPIPEEPVYQEPIPEEPVHQEPIPEEPVHQEPIPNEPVQEEPIPEEPVQEEPIPEEPVQEEPIPEEPVQEEPIPEEAVSEAPVSEAVMRRVAPFRVPSRNWMRN